jgi:hypothetical protein
VFERIGLVEEIEDDLPIAATTQASTAPTTSPGRTYTRLQLPTGVKVTWDAPTKGEKIWQYAVYSKHGNLWKMQVLPGDTTEVVIRDNPGRWTDQARRQREAVD